MIRYFVVLCCKISDHWISFDCVWDLLCMIKGRKKKKREKKTVGYSEVCHNSIKDQEAQML